AVYPVDITPAPLTVGSLVSGALPTPGEQDRYTFTLPGVTLLYFDVLTSNSPLTWTLVGPAGTAVNTHGFTDGTVRVPAGDYTLTMDAPGDLTGAYAFRLGDLAQATALTPGTPVSGELNPANESDLYRFTAAAGDRFFFDLQARTNPGNSLWRLIDPYGNAVLNKSFDNTTISDVGPTTLAQAGVYTPLLEGGVRGTVPRTYTFLGVPPGNTPP